VTGPDEYTVAVNNDMYTNVLARFVLDYGVQVVTQLKSKHADAWKKLSRKLDFSEAETRDWASRAKRMRIPFDAELGIHPQHDTFLEMEPIDLKTKFPEKWLPAWRDCPWDYLIRAQVIKQPDVLLAMFMFCDQFDQRTKRANYDFYDPKTMHESSLGPCIHSIIASETGKAGEAFDYYMRGARLDLDERGSDGIRIANAARSWMCLVNGFAGMRVHTETGELSFDPHLPEQWRALSLTMQFRARRLRVELLEDESVFRLDGEALPIRVCWKKVMLRNNAEERVVVAD
jgi:trehalose/maltose hydrolase-like predicted phosphorylase